MTPSAGWPGCFTSPSRSAGCGGTECATRTGVSYEARESAEHERFGFAARTRQHRGASNDSRRYPGDRLVQACRRLERIREPALVALYGYPGRLGPGAGVERGGPARRPSEVEREVCG